MQKGLFVNKLMAAKLCDRHSGDISKSNHDLCGVRFTSSSMQTKPKKTPAKKIGERGKRVGFYFLNCFQVLQSLLLSRKHFY
jgi:hypothetical protein